MSERVYKNIETVHIILVNYAPLPSINKMIKIVFIADIKICSLRVRKSISLNYQLELQDKSHTIEKTLPGSEG